ncbi:MAG: TldD/PmbA family protein [Planctomycetota bacterium]|nr:TldD/PmbA family protein [Planctomycetota bacterium]
MKPRHWTILFLAGLLLPTLPAGAEEESALLKAMQEEMNRSFEKLGDAEEAPLYYLMYGVSEQIRHSLSATLGTIQREGSSHTRVLDIDLRVGSHELDNTHQIRGRGGFFGRGRGASRLSIDDDPLSIRATVWLATDRAFKAAQERLVRVTTDRAVKVEEEDLSDDFSKESPIVHLESPASIEVDKKAWAAKLKEYSAKFGEHPFVYSSGASLSAGVTNQYMVSTEGTKIQFGDTHIRLSLACSSMADDGMRLRRFRSFDARSWDKLPSDDEVMTVIDQLVEELAALREAPLAEPYTGPAILMNRASGVFFHEIFGHRIEGHRQKSESFGQTFTKMVGELVLPDFISVIDDPTMREFGGTDLNGHYPFDEEGVRAERVIVVEKGVLKNFLMSRSPVAGFTKSNGHGRREAGRKAVSRQGNLTVVSDKAVPFEKLREMLIEQIKSQGKEYGLIFDDISGGQTNTRRGRPQAFQVNPLLVRRVFADGRPDELVRGVDIVGTPLTSFNKIIATGDDSGIFNGRCGAESGWVPVSAISPSILVTEIEIEKSLKGQDRPPILPPPGHDPVAEE